MTGLAPNRDLRRIVFRCSLLSMAEKKVDVTSQDKFDTASAGETSRGVVDVLTTSRKRQNVDAHEMQNDYVQGRITSSLSTPRIGSGGIHTHRLQIMVTM